MRKSLKNNRLALSVASALAILVSVGVHADADSKIEFNIAAQSANKSLLELAKQAGSEVMIKKGVNAEMTLPALKGEYTLETALETLLRGTDLTYSLTKDGLVLLEERTQPEGAQKQENVEEVVVTGTRVRGMSAPVGAQFVTITREDMEREGLFTAADVVRSLPQNFSGVNAASTTTPRGDVSFLSVGQSAANLRGLGTSATLVLVNGRRVAGSPTFEGDGTVNLSTIPSGAIERVEILLDGASAIYGSDALGGVINFILRKSWQGAETSVRADIGANGGDTMELNQVLGTTWATGNVTATLTHTESDPVSARKAGFTTLDLRSRGGQDFRTSVTSSPSNPGNIREMDFTLLGSLPAGFSGSFTQADLSPNNVVRFDQPAIEGQEGTRDARTSTVSLNVEQSLTDGISLFGDVMYGRNVNSRTSSLSTASLIVPASNPFNSLGRSVRVNYLITPDEGVVTASNKSELTRISANFGARFDLPRDWRLEALGTYGEEERRVESRQLDTSGTAFQNALAGAGPAFNPFTGEHEPGLDLASFVVPGELEITPTELKAGELNANGSVFSIPGGEVRLAIGAQYRTESIDYSNSSFEQLLHSLGSGISPVLKRDAEVLYSEVMVPVIGRENALPGVQELLFTVAGRWERYTITPPDPAEAEAEFNATSPRVGFSWRVADSLKLRGSWSNAFRAPSLVELGEPFRVLIEDWSILDLGHPSGTPTEVIGIPLMAGGNLDLEAETTDNLSFGFDWTPELLAGTRVSVTYTKIDWYDKISTASPFSDPDLLLRSDEFPTLIPRDTAGNLLAIVVMPVNIASSTLEVIDLDIERYFQTSWGDFNVQATAVYTLDAAQSDVSGTEILEAVGTERGPDDLVVNGRIGWSRSNYGLNLNIRYSSSYTNTGFGARLTRPATFGLPHSVDSYTTVDLTGHYETASKWTFNAGIRNLLNATFPFIDERSAPYDASRVDPKGRTFYLQVKKAFDF